MKMSANQLPRPKLDKWSIRILGIVALGSFFKRCLQLDEFGWSHLLCLINRGTRTHHAGPRQVSWSRWGRGKSLVALDLLRFNWIIYSAPLRLLLEVISACKANNIGGISKIGRLKYVDYTIVGLTWRGVKGWLWRCLSCTHRQDLEASSEFGCTLTRQKVNDRQKTWPSSRRFRKPEKKKEPSVRTEARWLITVLLNSTLGI